MSNLNFINNFNLDIGKCNNDEFAYEFTSNLIISNFYTNPFGSNSRRFQFPDSFTYELHKFDYKNDEFKYKLIIKKNNNALLNSPNMKYFWNKGWKLNLSITGFNHNFININDININMINSFLPENYANINLICNKLNLNIIKCGIVIPIFSRNEYVEKTLTSIKNSNIKNCLIILMDESLTKDVNEDKIKCNKLVDEFNFKNNIILKIFKKNHGNMFDSILRGMDILYRFTNYLITIDSDTVHKENWINILINTYENVQKKYSDKNILLTGFNTINTGSHNILKEFDNYYLKDSFGGCNMFFNRELYINYIRYCLNSYKWDTNIINLLKNNNTLFVASKPSVINHIGKISSGHKIIFDNNHNNNSHDYAFDF